MPKRIQRQRTKGWRMPANAVYVGRPGKFGNHAGSNLNKMTRPHMVNLFRAWVKDLATPDWIASAKAELRGKDLACWCPVGEPCHADILLEIANS